MPNINVSQKVLIEKIIRFMEIDSNFSATEESSNGAAAAAAASASQLHDQKPPKNAAENTHSPTTSLRSALTFALTTRDKDGVSGLQTVLQYAPEAIEEIILLAEEECRSPEVSHDSKTSSLLAAVPASSPTPQLSAQELQAKEFRERIKKIERGLCFGFSVIYGYMHATGKLTWWEALLESIALWDGTTKELDDVLHLPDAEPGEKNTTLRYLLNRFVHYVLYNFGGTSKSALANHHQHLFLININASKSKKEDYLVFDSMEGSVKDYAVIAGYLDDFMLRQIFQPQLFSLKKTIYLIKNSPHACYICFDDKQNKWLFFDSNNSSGKQLFNNPKDLISKISSRLGYSLFIEAISFNEENSLTEFRSCCKNLFSIPSVLQKDGLHLIAKCQSTQLDVLIHLTENNEIIAHAFAEALCTQDQNHWTGLHIIARYAPNQLDALIRLAGSNEGIARAFAEALCTQDQNHWTGLHIIARYAPDQLDALIDLAENNEAIRLALAATVSMKNKNGWTGLKMLVRSGTSSTVKKLFQLARKNIFTFSQPGNNEGAAAPAQAGSASVSSEETSLKALAEYNKHNMPGNILMLLAILSYIAYLFFTLPLSKNASLVDELKAILRSDPNDATSKKILHAIEKVNAEQVEARIFNFTAEIEIEKKLRETKISYFQYRKSEKEFSVTLKKILEKKFEGKKINFVTLENSKDYFRQPVLPDEIWVFHDLNPSDCWMNPLFKRVVIGAHTNGSKLFVTSSQPYEEILSKSFQYSVEESRLNRRARELLGIFEPSHRIRAIDADDATARQHDKTKLNRLNQLISTHAKLLTNSVRAELQKHFPVLQFIAGDNGFVISANPTYLSSEDLGRLLMDLSFFTSNPGVAIESICCRLDNYEPKTDAQQKLLKEANRVMQPEDFHRTLGAFFSGGPGIGKTHLSIGIAKLLIARDFEVKFFTPERPDDFWKIPLTPNQAWIFDDFNSSMECYHMREKFLKAISHARNKGGKVFVTSNFSFEDIIKNCYFEAKYVELAQVFDMVPMPPIQRPVLSNFFRAVDTKPTLFLSSNHTLSNTVNLRGLASRHDPKKNNIQ